MRLEGTNISVILHLYFQTSIVISIKIIGIKIDSSYQRISHLTVRSAAEYRSGGENGCELSISAKG